MGTRKSYTAAMHGRAATGSRLAVLALAWLAGVAVHLYQAALWPEGAMVAGIGLGALGVVAGWRWRRRRLFVLAVMGAALLAFGGAGWRADVRLADALPAGLEGIDLSVTGVVTSLPQQGGSGTRFRFEVEHAETAESGRMVPVHLPPLLALGWYDGWGEREPSDAQRSLRAGQRWRFTLRLARPHGNLNPHGFDYELLLFERGVRATGYVREGSASAGAPVLLHRAAGYPVERLRQRVRDAIEAHVPDRRAAGVLAALAVGDQGAIEREDWDLYRDAGVAHLVSISGLHITMFAWLAGAAVGWLWRYSGRAMLWLPAPLAARWGGLACAAAYAVVSGWGVPSQRTILMLAVVTLLQRLGLRWPWGLVLLASAVVVTALDPWALTQAGFWLSFAAVGLLMASSNDGAPAARGEPVAGFRGWPGRIGGHLGAGLRTQVIATIGLAPLTLVIFRQVSVIGFAANLVAIPVVTLLITPLALLGMAAAPLWTFGAWTVGRLNDVLGWLTAWPGAVWLAPVAPAWAQIVGLVGAVLLVLPLPRRVRWLALPLLVPLLWPPVDRPAVGSFELLALDVGQGTSVLIRTRSHLLVFDAGPRYSAESDAGDRVLLPLLRARGERRIDRLVLSHRDLDHVGGARAVLAAMPVDDVLSSLEPGHPLLAAASHVTRCEAGQSWTWDGVRFDILRPLADDYRRELKSNAMSCVLRVEGGGVALLTGDIERDQEAALIATDPARLRSDVLVVPHHGSKTSSSGAFLDAVRPDVAIFQAGYRNRYGHPAAEVLARYRARGIVTAATTACGAYRWSSGRSTSGAAAAGRCERVAARRYWHLDVEATD